MKGTHACMYQRILIYYNFQSDIRGIHAQKNFPYTATIVKVPHLYLFNQETNTQVLEDIAGAVDLETILVSPTVNDTLSQSLSTSIGRALGSWLRSFHNWISAPSQVDLRIEIGENEPMRKLKYLITYDSFIEVVEQFPEILGGNKKTLENVKDMAAKEFQKMARDMRAEDWGIIHGDFWTGK